jgi:CheY-like chemotaxis protein
MTNERNSANHTHANGDTAGKPSVLVVDDDASLIRLLRVILRTANYHVETAVNGLDALDLTDRQHIDVIVMDLQMPVLDGAGFFRELRARGDQTPVLVASSYGAHSARKELGAEAAIEKPFDPEDLIEAVAGLLRVEPAT